MSTAEMKTEIHTLLEQVEDSYVEAIHTLLNAHVGKQDDPIISYDIDGNPQYASQMKEIFLEQLEEVKKGNFVTHEEFKKQSKAWLTNSSTD